MSFALVLSLALAQAPAEAAPVVADAPPPAALEAPKDLAKPTTENVERPGTTQTPWWQRIQIDGFARIGVFYTFPFREEQLVGGNGGFRLADFRIGMDFHPVDKLWINTSIELAAPLVNPNDPLTGSRIVDLRDAFVQYDITDFLQVRAGQFRPPYYAEMLQSDGHIPFVSRSILAGGLQPPEGYGPRNGIAPERQVGVQVGSARLGGDAFGFKYAVGVFNGNALNQLFNDNNSVMPVARIELDVFKKVTLGLNGSYNQRTDGVRPNRVTANQLSYGADVVARPVEGLSLLAGFLGKSITYSYAGLPPDSQLGAMGQARYFHEPTGLEAAARFAWMEPSGAQVDDQVIEVAAMVGWRPFKLPFRILVQYTHRNEEARAAYDNDSVDAMLHAVW